MTANDLLRLQKLEGRIAPVTKSEEQVILNALKLAAVVAHPDCFKVAPSPVADPDGGQHMHPLVWFLEPRGRGSVMTPRAIHTPPSTIEAAYAALYGEENER